jgi:hypothetical protein
MSPNTSFVLQELFLIRGTRPLAIQESAGRNAGQSVFRRRENLGIDRDLTDQETVPARRPALTGNQNLAFAMGLAQAQATRQRTQDDRFQRSGKVG